MKTLVNLKTEKEKIIAKVSDFCLNILFSSQNYTNFTSDYQSYFYDTIFMTRIDLYSLILEGIR